MPPRKAPARPTQRSASRKPGNQPRSQKSHGPKRSGGGGNPMGKIFAILGGVIVLGLIGWGVYKLIHTEKGPTRADLDAYVEMENDTTGLEPGVNFYLDFSNGMNYAYQNPTVNRALKDIINKFSDISLVKFNSLADGKIEPLNMPGNEIYHRVLAPESFSQQQAPIAKALEDIIKKGQAAVLVTDYEEFNGSFIEQAAYAKTAFTEWLNNYGNILFYKVDYMEGSRPKKLFFTIFDCNTVVTPMIDQTMAPFCMQGGMERFMAGGKNFFYPMQLLTSDITYMKANNGGNYHDATTGEDFVTAVMEDGNPEAYKRYYGNVASAYGNGNYLPLTEFQGQAAEYYPIGIPSWKQVLENVKAFSDKSMKNQTAYTHLLQGLLVNFQAQDGYEINGIEARCFNFNEVLTVFAKTGNAVKDSSAAVQKKAMLEMKLPEAKEVHDVFTASMSPAEQGNGWYDIFVDFDQKFDGIFSDGKTKDKDLLRINIMISGATMQTQKVMDFFSWPGNESLAESVRHALEYTPPQGHLLWSYYLKLQ